VESDVETKIAFNSVNVGVDPAPLIQTRSDEEYHGGSTVLNPTLVDAIWHVWRSLTMERVADEHLTEFYFMDSARQ
jgi:hypothetical protein